VADDKNTGITAQHVADWIRKYATSAPWGHEVGSGNPGADY